MLIEHERGQDRKVRTRRRVEVALRPAEQPIPAEEFRRREQELERLIVKAAYRRAVRLATQPPSDTEQSSGEEGLLHMWDASGAERSRPADPARPRHAGSRVEGRR